MLHDLFIITLIIGLMQIWYNFCWYFCPVPPQDVTSPVLPFEGGDSGSYECADFGCGLDLL